MWSLCEQVICISRNACLWQVYMHADCFGIRMWVDQSGGALARISTWSQPVVNAVCTAGLLTFPPPVPLLYTFIIYFSPSSSYPSLTSIILSFFSLTVSFSSDLPLHPFALTKTIRLCVLHFTLYFMLPFGQVSKIIK